MSPPRLPVWAAAGLAAWFALLLLAPPDVNLFWGVNGFRSLSTPVRIVVLAAAALGLGVVLRPGAFAAAGAALLAALLASPLREAIHLLGDTQLRHRLIEDLAAGHGGLLNLEGFRAVLHAKPLDALVNVSGVAAIARAGVPPPDAVAAVGLLCLLLYAGAVRRIVADAAPASGAAALTAAALLAGTLQAFAGYADSWGLVLALAAWWWAFLGAPLDRPRNAVWISAAWLALFMTHRVALLLLVAQLWRGLGPAFEGDTREGRRLHIGLTFAAIVVGTGLSMLTGPSQIGRDAADFLNSTVSGGSLRLVAPWDLANLVLLVAPLAIAAPWLAGGEACARMRRHPLLPLLAAALVPLLPMLLVFPAAPHGLGAQRDWDLAALFGAIATAGAVALLARAPASRLRAALAIAVPLLAVQSLAWVAVNADARAAERRAEAIVEGRWGPRVEQRSHALVFLAYRAAGRHEYALAARRFGGAADLLPNPRHPLIAAQCWVLAGDLTEARRSYGRAMAMNPRDPRTLETARTVLAMIRGAEAARPPEAYER